MPLLYPPGDVPAPYRHPRYYNRVLHARELEISDLGPPYVFTRRIPTFRGEINSVSACVFDHLIGNYYIWDSGFSSFAGSEIVEHTPNSKSTRDLGWEAATEGILQEHGENAYTALIEGRAQAGPWGFHASKITRMFNTIARWGRERGLGPIVDKIAGDLEVRMWGEERRPEAFIDGVSVTPKEARDYLQRTDVLESLRGQFYTKELLDRNGRPFPSTKFYREIFGRAVKVPRPDACYEPNIEAPGSLYVLSNPCFPGDRKIGKASDVQKRVATLNTGVPRDFIIEYVHSTPHPTRLERMVHAKLFKHRINREFFRVSLDTAKRAINDCASV